MCVRWVAGRREAALKGAVSIDMDFSLVVPCFNEKENVGAFLRAATACLDDSGVEYELIFVDDGSSDGTVIELKSVISSYLDKVQHPHESNLAGSFKVIELSRNFGKESALYAGLEHAEGDCIGFIDADLQQEPTVALDMYRILQREPDVDSVAAAPKKRKESPFLRACKEAFYRVFNGVSDTKLLADVSDFRVFRRSVANTLLDMHEQYRFSKGLFSWAGFHTKVIEYDVKERFSGKSRWTFRGLSSYAWNGVLSFSTCPLSAVSFIGALLIACSFVGLVCLLCAIFAFHQEISLLLPVFDALACLGGIQLVALGMVGEYSARSYIESKQRPVYVARAEIDYPAQRPVRPSLRVLRGKANGKESAAFSSSLKTAETFCSSASNGTYGTDGAERLSSVSRTPDIRVMICGKTKAKH